MPESITNWLKNFDNVILLGELDSSAVLRLMLKTEVLLALGVETFGFALIEAATSGMKVVTTRFAGASNLLAGWEGLYFSHTLCLEELALTAKTALLAKTPLPFVIPYEQVELSWKRIVDSISNREKRL
jgi:glycosyltransferase involved in cell wall biosynthesis